jgi:copper(I)-binding protein
MKLHWIASITLACFAQQAQAHVVLSEPQAQAGAYFKASLRVGHGCSGSATTGITVTVPAGFQGAKPQPKAGWEVVTRKAKLAQPYTSHGKLITEDVVELRWTASSKESALLDEHFDEFSFMSRLPDQAGPVWLKVLQTCEVGQTDWSEVPSSGTSTKGLKSPAALLMIKSDNAAVTSAAGITVSEAWVRPTVAGQKATGAFMKLTAKESAKLVGVSSPVAGVAEIHEMKMEKDVMKMAAIPSLNLPSGKTVELKPGGFHVMLMDLKSQIANNSKVPLVLHFQDAKGVKSQMDIQLEAGMPHQH